MDNKVVLRWEPSDDGTWVQRELAVVGGQDMNGELMFIGRAFREGDVIPGKIIPSHGACYVSWSGREYRHSDYQILTTVDAAEIIWIPSSDGMVPTGAVQGGATSSGEPLFIGRAMQNGFYMVGKIHPSHEVLYTPFDGSESSHRHYEVLCIKTITF